MAENLRRTIEHLQHELTIAQNRIAMLEQKLSDCSSALNPLAESNLQRYQEIVEEQTELICLYDADFKLTFVNRAYSDSYGKLPEDLIGTRFIDNIPPENRAPALNKINALTIDNPVSKSEHPTILPNKELRWYEWHDRAIFDENGTFIEYQGVGRDITDRKLAEQKLQLLQAAVEHSEDALIITDSSINIVSVNPAFTKLTGYSAEEAINQSAFSFLTGKTATDDWSDFSTQSVDGNSFRGELTTTHKNGTQHYVSWSTAPIPDENGNITHYVTVVRDVTERRQQMLLQTRMSDVLEGIAIDVPLPKILETLVYAIEEFAPGVKASVLLYNPTDETLHLGAAPSLPEPYNSAIEGVKIGPNRGSCGTAAYEKKTVIVEDIKTDPRWTDYRDLAAQHQLEACWSQPIFDHDGSVLGTFALYYDHPNTPHQSELDLVQMAAHTAGIAIRRKQEEDELRASEEKYRSLLESSDASISMVSEDGTYLYLNEFAAQRFQVSPASLIGKTVFDLFGQETGAQILADVQKVIHQNSGLTLEPMVMIGGRRCWFRTSIQPVLNGEGNPFAAFIHASDITDIKMAEFNVRESEARQRALLQAIPDLMFRLNADGIFIDYHAPAKDMLAYPPESFMGKVPHEVFPAEFADLVMETTATVRESGKLKTIEYQMDLRGNLRDYEARFVPIENEQVLTLIRDVTERKEAEIALTQSERRYRQMFELHHVPKLIIHPDTAKILDANPAAVEFYGYPEDVLKTMTMMDINVATPQEVMDKMKKARNKEVASCMFQQKTADGSLRYVEIYTGPIYIDGEERLYSLITDITDRKRAEQELESLYNATAYLFHSDSLASLGQQIVAAVVQEFVHLDCGLMLVADDQKNIIRLARSGQTRIQPSAPLTVDGGGLVPLAIRTGNTIYVPDVTQSPDYISNESSTHSELVIPLKTSRGVIAVLDLQRAEVDAFSPRDQRLLTAYAERAAAALENMQLYEKVNRHAEELEERVQERTLELERFKNRVEAILNHSGDGIILLDVKHGIEQANSTFDEFFGVDHDSYFGEPLRSFLDPHEFDKVGDIIQDVVTTHETRHLQTQAIRHDGSTFDAEISLSPVNRIEDDVSQLVCIIRDISERKRAEQAIAEERNLLRTLIDAVPDFIYVKDTQHRFLLTNKAHAQARGYENPNDLIGKTDFDLFPQVLAKTFKDEEIAIIQHGRSLIDYEQPSQGYAGGFEWASSNKVPLRNLQGDIIGLVGITHDITQIKASEEALRRSQADLQSIIDSVNTAFVLFDHNGVIRVVNQVAYQYYRDFYNLVPEIGARFVDSIPLEAHEGFNKRFAQTMGGDTVTVNFTQPINNQPQHFLANYYPVKSPEGEVLGVNMAVKDVTEEKETEQKLRYLASLQESMHDAVIGTDLNFHIQSWNKAAERIYGWTAEEAMGQRLAELIQTKFETEGTAEDARQTLLKNGVWEGEVIQQHHDGYPINILGSIVILKDEEGNPTGIVGVNHDISERKLAEEALAQKYEEEHQMQEYLKALHEVSIELTRTETLDEFYRMAVDSGLRQFNFDRIGLLLYDEESGNAIGTYGTDAEGKLIDEHHISFDPNSLTGILKKTMSRNERFAFLEDAVLYSPEHEPMGRGWTAAAALWDGPVLGWLSMDNGAHHQPVTQAQLEIFSLYAMTVGSLLARKHSEDALRASEELYRTLITTMSEGIIMQDKTGVITTSNTAAQEILGLSSEYLLGVNSSKSLLRSIREDGTPFPDESRPSMITLKTGKAQSNVVMGVYKTNEELAWISINSSPVRQPGEKSHYAVVTTFRDITHHKNYEQMLEKALENEKELGELKSRFVSMASHEFRTPLATILALTETLSAYRHKLPDEQIDERLNKIQGQVSHLKDIIEDVLQLARIQARRVEVNPVRFDLDDLCRSVIDEFVSHPDFKQKINYHCDEKLHYVNLDKKLLRQVISNLMSNAVKYSPEGKSITINLTYDNDVITLRISDEGIGIPEADLKHLFEPFHRATNVGTISGTGLGLVIVKESIELHGGTILVESHVGQGTTFVARIPGAVNGVLVHDENSSD